MPSPLYHNKRPSYILIWKQHWKLSNRELGRPCFWNKMCYVLLFQGLSVPNILFESCYIFYHLIREHFHLYCWHFQKKFIITMVRYQENKLQGIYCYKSWNFRLTKHLHTTEWFRLSSASLDMLLSCLTISIQWSSKPTKIFLKKHFLTEKYKAA